MKIPEPRLPEHQLLRDAAQWPQVSSGLRGRVIVDVRRQLRYGRWADRLRIAGAVMAASLMVFLVWNFRWTGQQSVAERRSDTIESSPSPITQGLPTRPGGTYSVGGSSPGTPVPPALPQGGPSSLPDMKEMQHLNKLIEDIQGRNNILCGLLPIL